MECLNPDIESLSKRVLLDSAKTYACSAYRFSMMILCRSAILSRFHHDPRLADLPSVHFRSHLTEELIDHHQKSSSHHTWASSSHDSLPFTLDGRNPRCSELKNQARRCTPGTYNFESHLAYRTPVIQQRLPPLLLLLGSSVRHVSRNHRHPKAF